jgi:hypothetical protein
VDHRAAGGFERAGSRLHFHHMERLDTGDARGERRAEVQRKA